MKLPQTGGFEVENAQLRRLSSRVYNLLDRGQIREQDISNSLYIEDLSGSTELFFNGSALTVSGEIYQSPFSIEITEPQNYIYPRTIEDDNGEYTPHLDMSGSKIENIKFLNMNNYTDVVNTPSNEDAFYVLNGDPYFKGQLLERGIEYWREAKLNDISNIELIEARPLNLKDARLNRAYNLQMLFQAGAPSVSDSNLHGNLNLKEENNSGVLYVNDKRVSPFLYENATDYKLLYDICGNGKSINGLDNVSNNTQTINTRLTNEGATDLNGLLTVNGSSVHTSSALFNETLTTEGTNFFNGPNNYFSQDTSFNRTQTSGQATFDGTSTFNSDVSFNGNTTNMNSTNTNMNGGTYYPNQNNFFLYEADWVNTIGPTNALDLAHIWDGNTFFANRGVGYKNYDFHQNFGHYLYAYKMFNRIVERSSSANGTYTMSIGGFIDGVTTNNVFCYPLYRFQSYDHFNNDGGNTVGGKSVVEMDYASVMIALTCPRAIFTEGRIGHLDVNSITNLSEMISKGASNLFSFLTEAGDLMGKLKWIGAGLAGALVFSTGLLALGIGTGLGAASGVAYGGSDSEEGAILYAGGSAAPINAGFWGRPSESPYDDTSLIYFTSSKGFALNPDGTLSGSTQYTRDKLFMFGVNQQSLTFGLNLPCLSLENGSKITALPETEIWGDTKAGAYGNEFACMTYEPVLGFSHSQELFSVGLKNYTGSFTGNYLNVNSRNFENVNTQNRLYAINGELYYNNEKVNKPVANENPFIINDNSQADVEIRLTSPINNRSFIIGTSANLNGYDFINSNSTDGGGFHVGLSLQVNGADYLRMSSIAVNNLPTPILSLRSHLFFSGVAFVDGLPVSTDKVLYLENGVLKFDGQPLGIAGDFVLKTGDTMTGALLFNSSGNQGGIQSNSSLNALQILGRANTTDNTLEEKLRIVANAINIYEPTYHNFNVILNADNLGIIFDVNNQANSKLVRNTSTQRLEYNSTALAYVTELDKYFTLSGTEATAVYDTTFNNSIKIGVYQPPNTANRLWTDVNNNLFWNTQLISRHTSNTFLPLFFGSDNILDLNSNQLIIDVFSTTNNFIFQGEGNGLTYPFINFSPFVRQRLDGSLNPNFKISGNDSNFSGNISFSLAKGGRDGNNIPFEATERIRLEADGNMLFLDHNQNALVSITPASSRFYKETRFDEAIEIITHTPLSTSQRLYTPNGTDLYWNGNIIGSSGNEDKYFFLTTDPILGFTSANSQTGIDAFIYTDAPINIKNSAHPSTNMALINKSGINVIDTQGIFEVECDSDIRLQTDSQTVFFDRADGTVYFAFVGQAWSAGNIIKMSFGNAIGREIYASFNDGIVFNTNNNLLIHGNTQTYRSNGEIGIYESGSTYIVNQTSAQLRANRTVATWFVGLGAFGGGFNPLFGNGNWAGGSSQLLFSHEGATGNMVITGGLTQNSDRRIKKNIEPIDDNESLTLLRKIEAYKYNYIDKSKGTEKVYGWIANEVREHFEPATSLSTQVIPNVLKRVDISGDIIRLKEATDVFIKVGQQILIKELVGEDDFDYSETKVTITEKIDFLTYRVSYNYKATSGLWYGNFINDFVQIQKEKLVPILWSACQQLDNKITTRDETIATLTIENNELKSRLDRIESLLLRNGIK